MRISCLFSLFVRRSQTRLAAVRIGQITLLPATDIDDGVRRHEAILRLAPQAWVGARWSGHSVNLVARCGRGLPCSRRRILGEDVEGVSRSERSRVRAVLW